jgi:hypothetical protein
VSVHGYPRYTKDFDICIKISEINAEKMVNVIKDFGLGSLELTKDDFLKKDFIYTVRRRTSAYRYFK